MKPAKIYLFFYLIIVMTFFISCKNEKKLIPAEGFIHLKAGKIYYRIVGKGAKTPLLTLHGGPGVPSYYLNPLEALSKDRPVIFFDQLGCGRSDRITDTSLMTVENFVDQLKQIRDSLGLKDYYLYGQSWGTMLGTDFYLKYPAGIKAIILSSPAISIPLWLADADTLIATLPDSVQQAIRINEQNKTYDNPGYQQAVRIYYEHYVARKLPWSADVDSAFSPTKMGVNFYVYMGGPSEFTITGPLKDYDRTNRLKEIKVPTLFITGEFDEARPSTVRYYQSLVPGAKFEMIEGAGHLTMQDNPQKNNEVITRFINGTEKYPSGI
ncbi:MAG: proline iminopeptidase-family hydrolase [Bacteroidia bacterium]